MNGKNSRYKLGIFLLVLVASSSCFVACGNDSDTDSGTDSDTDTDTDTDTDMDTGSDTDTDSDTDIDAGPDAGDGGTTELYWVSISGGSYEMGSSFGSADEKPVHEVTIPAFEILKTEVTVAQYGVCVTEGSCTDPIPNDAGNECNWNEAGYGDHPVNCVDWNQAVAFCSWAEGRLLTESEWEYAARSLGQVIVFPWGNEQATCDYAIMDESTEDSRGDNSVGGEGCETGRTWKVCSKTTGNTDHELCDMAGNVWEWVQDFYHSTYEGAPDDGSGWEDPVDPNRVIRGGGFFNYSPLLTTTKRTDFTPSDVYSGLGFRCAK